MKKKIYSVATAHLDTSWRWTFEETVSQYLEKTLRENFELFEKYPEYVFSFEGAYRYELMEEYFPELFAKMKKYIAAGRWKVSGSSYENGDMNIPSPEALFRNILYGNSYFEEKFNKRSTDIYLPDCFGFGAALPSVAAHAGLNGFTTQKLPWSSSIGIPFDLGVWQGINGEKIFACLDAESYSSTPKTVRKNKKLLRKLTSNSIHFDFPATHALYGVGDQGGAPKEEGVKAVVNEIRKNRSEDIEVVAAATDTIFNEMEKLPEQVKEKLPVFKGELLSTDHGVGCYTSRTPSKRFNRQNENLAFMTESLCVTASLLGVYDYPAEKLNRAWKRVIAHQFHDDITGTSLPECYKRNWNDYIMSLNEFSEEYRAAAAAVSTVTDTSFCSGVPVIVHNALQYSRKESVEIHLAGSYNFTYAAVFDINGREVPSQYKMNEDGSLDVIFTAEVPGFSVCAFDIRNVIPAFNEDDLLITERMLGNSRYKLKLDDNGDIVSCFDKLINKELLSAPIRMCLFDYEGSPVWPAWELTYKESKKEPASYASNAEFKIVESGSARVTLKVKRTSGESVFTQFISLERGDNFPKIFNEIEWRSLRTMLKVSFPTTAKNKEAAFDLGLGYKKRPNMTSKLYEVPAQMFADITDKSGEYGVSILSDCKTGWDKPSNNTLRLTALHTPKYAYRCFQNTLDIGLDRFGFAVCSHSTDSLVETVKNAACFNVPLTGFIVNKNATGNSLYSMFKINTDNCIVRCLKKAHFSDEVLVRVYEADNKQVKNVCITAVGGVNAVTELNASEEYLGEMSARGGALVFDLAPFKVRTFALTLNKAKREKAIKSTPVNIEKNVDFAGFNKEKSENPLPDSTLVPKELLPEKIVSGGIVFKLTDKATLCKGQTIDIGNNAEVLSIVAASFCGDVTEKFKVGEKEISVTVQSATERIGKWDMAVDNEVGRIKRDVLALDFTHSHSANGEDQMCRNMYFFRYEIPLNGETAITLPDNPDIVIVAMSAVENYPLAIPGKPLYDTLETREADFSSVCEEVKNYKYSTVKKEVIDEIARMGRKKRHFIREIKQITGNYIKE